MLVYCISLGESNLFHQIYLFAIMRRYLFVLFCFFVSARVLLAQGSWIEKASLPAGYARYVGVSFVIGPNAYVGLGQLNNGIRVYDFWQYNATDDKWTRKADYPGVGSYAATAFAINGKGYVCLGADQNTTCQKDLWEYTPETDTWVKRSDFPGQPRYGASCFSVGDTAYIGTGSAGGPPYLYDMWMYIPKSDSWHPVADFPGYGRLHATSFNIGKYGYMGTGYSYSTSVTHDFWKYNPLNNAWTPILDLPGLPRGNAACFVIDAKAYVGSGEDLITNYNNFYRYNPILGVWDAMIAGAENMQLRRGALGFAIDGKGYLCTGYSTSGALHDLWSLGIHTDVTVESVSNAAETEGKTLLHHVALTGITDQTYSFEFLLKDITTTSGMDYSEIPVLSNAVTYNNTTGQILVPTGVSTFDVIISPLDDLIDENLESYSLTVGTVKSSGLIFDNDTVVVTSISSAIETEGNGLLHTVNLSGISDTCKTYSFSMLDVTTTSGSDYFSEPFFNNGVVLDFLPGKIIVPAGVRSFIVSVRSIDDEEIEKTENYTIGISRNSATGQILDNDSVESPKSAIVLYPSVVSDFLNIQTRFASSTMYIYDIKGNLLLKAVITDSFTRFDLRNLRMGTYIIKLVSGTSVKIRKISKS